MLQAVPQHFLPPRNRWTDGVSNRSCSLSVTNATASLDSTRGFTSPRRRFGALPAPTRCEESGEPHTPPPAPGKPLPPRRHYGVIDPAETSACAWPPLSATGPASPRPSKARPPPNTDGLGSKPTGLPWLSRSRRRSRSPPGRSAAADRCPHPR